MKSPLVLILVGILLMGCQRVLISSGSPGNSQQNDNVSNTAETLDLPPSSERNLTAGDDGAVDRKDSTLAERML